MKLWFHPKKAKQNKTNNNQTSDMCETQRQNHFWRTKLQVILEAGFKSEMLWRLTGGHWASLSAATIWTLRCLAWDLPLDLMSRCSTWRQMRTERNKTIQIVLETNLNESFVWTITKSVTKNLIDLIPLLLDFTWVLESEMMSTSQNYCSFSLLYVCDSYNHKLIFRFKF